MEQICQVLFNVVEMINYILGYILLFQMKPKKKPVLIIGFLAGCALLGSLNIICDWGLDRVVLNFGYGLLIPIFILDDKKIKGVLLLIDVIFFTTTINVCISRGYAVISGKYISNFANIYEGLLQDVIFLIIALVILLYIKFIKKSEIKKNDFSVLQYILITIGIIGLSVMTGFIEGLATEEDISKSLINKYEFFSTLACIVFFGVAVWLSVSTKRNTQYKMEQEMYNLYLRKQEEYIENVIEKDTQAKKFRHDIKNHMSILGEYINNGDIEKAKEYIERINGFTENIKVERYTGIGVVDAVISHMCNNMDKAIDFQWEGSITDEKNIDVFDMCTLFVNIMKNAIEACEKCIGDKYIKVKIYQYNEMIKIYEENTFCGDIKVDKGGNLITLKEDNVNHGFGSKNIRSVVEKYDGVIKLEYDENIFKLDIMI